MIFSCFSGTTLYSGLEYASQLSSYIFLRSLETRTALAQDDVASAGCLCLPHATPAEEIEQLILVSLVPQPLLKTECKPLMPYRPFLLKSFLLWELSHYLCYLRNCNHWQSFRGNQNVGQALRERRNPLEIFGSLVGHMWLIVLFLREGWLRWNAGRVSRGHGRQPISSPNLSLRANETAR